MTQTPVASDVHVLRVESVELVGGFRTVTLQSGYNLIRGDITTGKTTFVRLLRGLLGAIPRHLPPETAVVRSISAQLVLGSRQWQVLRPLVTTKNTPVEVAEAGTGEDDPGIALRLPAAGAGGFGEFLLKRLAVPVVLVPKARQDPTAELSPVTINDWLNYCIVPGDELDAQVFGHRDAFRDSKRKWVFEVLYGLYDAELAELNAEVSRLDKLIASTEAEQEIVAKFLAEVGVGDRTWLEAEKAVQEESRARLQRARDELAEESSAEPAGEISTLRNQVLQLRERLDVAGADERNIQAQLNGLSDLERELVALSKRLTRSIVADEWMVDFEFVVCPRCGQNVDHHRAEAPICYLCEQPEPETAPSRDTLLQEQDRVTFQIAETRELLGARQGELDALRAVRRQLEHDLRDDSLRLDALTEEFVSAHASQLQELAAEEATAAANLEWIDRMLKLFRRLETQEERLAELRSARDLLVEQLGEHQQSIAEGEEHISALQDRMVNYLGRLNVPTLGDTLTVKINRTTYLPEVSTRSFDELSSQGLKTLVNVAHALAHHTVAIDRGLPLPGFLVLDGVSANSGREGLDGDRVLDMYRLFQEVSEHYGHLLQLIIVDNEVPEPIVEDAEGEGRIALTLTQRDRLIRSAGAETEPAQ